MNRELREVRRYWPRARYVGWNWHGWQGEDDPGALYMRYSSERRWWRKRYELCLDEEQCGWRVIDSNQDQLGRGAAIAEAMRAAGFRRRGVWSYADHMAKNFPVGQYADHSRQRREYHRWLLTFGFRVPSSRRNFPLTCKLLAALTTGTDAADIALRPCDRLQSTQRPRKGARLGRRKREVQP